MQFSRSTKDYTGTVHASGFRDASTAQDRKVSSRYFLLCALACDKGALSLKMLHSQKSENHNKSDVPGTSIVNILCCVIVIWISSPVWMEFLSTVYLPEDQWYPRSILAGGILFLSSPFILFVVIISLLHVPKYLWIPFDRKHRRVLITEVVFVGLFILTLFQTQHMDSKIQELLEVRSERVLSRLRVAMSRRSVEALILEANAALIGPPREGWLTRTGDYQQRFYAKVQQSLETLRAGGVVDFEIFDERDIFRLVRIESNGSNQLFRRVYRFGPFSDDDTSYEISINYNNIDRLQSALYDRSTMGGILPCTVLYIGEAAPTAEESRLC